MPDIPYNSQWARRCPRSCPSPGGNPGHHVLPRWFLGSSAHLQTHLNWFSCFSTAYGCNQQTDRETHRQRYICSNKLASNALMRPNNKWYTVTDDSVGSDNVRLQSVCLGGSHATRELHHGRTLVTQHCGKCSHPFHAPGDVCPPITCNIITIISPSVHVCSTRASAGVTRLENLTRVGPFSYSTAANALIHSMHPAMSVH